ncbi:MAG: ATP-dependent helicase [Candidatus Omnitrophica bacterium]|nr:ATP-dependent helicase [Candidatus Omnitrophota bacterium]
MDSPDNLLADLTPTQREAVTHSDGPLLIIAGAGTGKTTVITRRIAWLIATGRAQPNEILALTFTDKAAAEMEERLDVLLPYGTVAVEVSTFHAFGDRLLREHAVETGLGPGARVLSKPEQTAFLRAHLFELPLDLFRPANDPARYAEAITTLIARAKDEAVSPEEFLEVIDALPEPADESGRRLAAQHRELARCYAVYQALLREDQAMDFGDQMLLAVLLLERHPHLREQRQRQLRYVLVDEFQDTNFAQFRLLQLLAPPNAQVTVVADDDQSIYKWRGAAISNVLKFLEYYQRVRRVVLTENFRSTQAILDSAYRLIRRNDPDRLEVTEQINKRLLAARPGAAGPEPTLAVFDTGSSEADWVARQIDARLRAGSHRPGDFAILVRTNREADLFLRALNVCGIPWQFSGIAGLFGKDSAKLLRSCLHVMADPEHSLSWYHVLSSELYNAPMADLIACMAQANRSHASLRAVLEQAVQRQEGDPGISPEGEATLTRFFADVARLMERSRTLSPGQLLYQWLTDTGWLKRLAALERAQDVEELQTIAQFFDQLHRMEQIVGNRLPELMQSLELFHALAESGEGTDPSAGDRVNVLTIHKAKGLEFPVVFMVGLVQGRFPTPQRRDPIELPDALIKDVLPGGNYHLQEERRLFYVGMTRAKDELYLTAAFHYGGRSTRKLSPFILEALPAEPPAVISPSPVERIARASPPPAADPSSSPLPPVSEPLRLDAHGLDDYLTCPLKFRYSHLLRIPIIRHHLVIYGSALHKAVEHFFTAQLRGQALTERDLLAAFEGAWSSQGFLSRSHETQRLEQGRSTLQRFFAEQQAAPEHPALIEEPFRFMLDDLLIVGRLDRVDRTPEGAVIIDYKSSDVDEQAQADRRARESLQLAVYALAWQTLHGALPIRVELRFLETGLTGTAVPSEEGMERTRQQLRTAAAGIRAGQFPAAPQEFTCRWCAYQAICSFSAS